MSSLGTTTSSATATWRTALAIAGGALIVGLLAGPLLNGTHSPAIARGATDGSNPPEHTISVSGQGKVTVVPDMATVSLGVNVERDTAKAARQAAADQMTKIVAALKALGIADQDIQTSNVSLGPTYDYPVNAQPKIRGYSLQNTVTVTVNNIDQVSDVVDDSVQAGATQVNGVTFDVKDRAAAEAKAREQAVKDARAKADTIATGLNVSITGVASVAEQVQTPIWYGNMMAAPAAGATDQAAQTPVMPGSTDVTITVQVSFLIP
jgi:uncharacterized protein YggE